MICSRRCCRNSNAELAEIAEGFLPAKDAKEREKNHFRAFLRLSRAIPLPELCVKEPSSTPFELVSQDVEIVAVRRLDEIERRRALAYHDAVTGLHRIAGLAVERECHALVLFFQLELDPRTIGNHDRPVRQREWANGRQDDRVHRRVNDRTAGRKIVSSRAGGRRYDQTVRPERV